MKATDTFINVKGAKIRIINRNGQDYFSLTDMLRSKNGNFVISDWLRNRNTVEFLDIWERVNNPVFNSGESAIIKTYAGLNGYKLSAQEWIEKTSAIGLMASPGRYGGTYAHVDIAFEFGMWISAEFKVYLIKEFHRLKGDEGKRLNSRWNLQRMLSRINYQIHTDAIKENLIPDLISRTQANKIYSSEADLLNVALFGMTAKDFRKRNPHVEGNLRDHATLEQLIVLCNLESINALLIEQGIGSIERLLQLNRAAISQMKSLLKNERVKQLTSGADRVEEPQSPYGLTG